MWQWAVLPGVLEEKPVAALHTSSSPKRPQHSPDPHGT